jgi:hypothetical protein
VTAEQAIKTAGENVPGTVVEAELEKKHGKTGSGSVWRRWKRHRGPHRRRDRNRH